MISTDRNVLTHGLGLPSPAGTRKRKDAPRHCNQYNKKENVTAERSGLSRQQFSGKSINAWMVPRCRSKAGVPRPAHSGLGAAIHCRRTFTHPGRRLSPLRALLCGKNRHPPLPPVPALPPPHAPVSHDSGGGGDRACHTTPTPWESGLPACGAVGCWRRPLCVPTGAGFPHSRDRRGVAPDLQPSNLHSLCVQNGPEMMRAVQQTPAIIPRTVVGCLPRTRRGNASTDGRKENGRGASV